MTELDNRLQEAIQERESLFFEIERAIFTRRYNLASKHQNILSAQSIPMIYASWEGFVQTAFNLYVEELNKSNIEIYEFCDEIIIYHIENSFKQFIDYPQRNNQKVKFFKDLRSFHTTAKHPLIRTINTQSNVGFQILNRLLKQFSLKEFPEHWQKYTYPSPSLKEALQTFLQMRNMIAHGSSSVVITHDIYNHYRSLVNDLIYEIRLKMLDGLSKQTYKQRNSS